MGTRYEICLTGGEIPEWFSHRGEGAALSFNLPSVSIPDVTFERNSTKHSWIRRVPLIGNRCKFIQKCSKCWVEKCGVHLIMEKSKADSDIHGERWDHEIDIHALGSSTTDDQRLESTLIRELQKWKITMLSNRRTFVQL
ncbi:hypothetical protein DKX38_026948 [Salix brachista]|uniref:Uncharacterized protein n=1 Tax=Salix brachista TaxID=2182728 RepID=A0A5N5JEU6_9ROSI|nr:hypothetical protein DKX38_026948 [Salix brachista]